MIYISTMNSINILYCCLFAPFKANASAGGQLAYYYVKKISEKQNVNLKLLCSVPAHDWEKLQPTVNEFDAEYFIEPSKNFLTKVITKLNFNKGCYFNQKSVNLFIKKAKKMNKEGFVPDYVIFDWETTAYIYDNLKKIWPSAKYSVVEQDVTSQSLERFYESEGNAMKKLYKKIVWKNCLRLEKKLFNKLYCVNVLSQKDVELVKNISSKAKTNIVAPYYHKYDDFELLQSKTKDILFFGYMAREENCEAVMWFVENILPKLTEGRFVVLGGGVPEKIKQLESEKVHITGFQTNEQLGEWFKNSLCMVVPLLHGAGVKIKVLEAMSAGIPVVTNSIGIEGISGTNGIDYLHCEKDEDYVCAINSLLNNNQKAYEIGTKSRELMNNTVNFEAADYLVL